jgi:hypothetical protein
MRSLKISITEVGGGQERHIYQKWKDVSLTKKLKKAVVELLREIADEVEDSGLPRAEEGPTRYG